jgi:hypothetical protein
MAAPNSRETIIDYALRNLGHPVIQINVDYQQCEDRLDEALEFFSERHFDGVEKAYFSHPMTQAEIDRKYIDIADLGPVNGPTGDGPTGNDIVSVIKIFQFNQFSSIDMFDIRYQLALTDYFGINRGLAGTPSLGVASYDSAKRYIKLIQDFFQPEKPIRFSKVTNRIHIDGTMSDVQEGVHAIIEAFVLLDPEKYKEIYNDRLLKKYLTALIKRQWGSNMAKYDGVQLPGGITLKGAQIYAEAQQEILALENELLNSYELPIDFSMG